MMTKDLDTLPTWNTVLRLPLVTDDSDLFELQILLGGITLVLSRLHPVFARNRFTYTRGLAMKIARILEGPAFSTDDLMGSAGSTGLTSAHLEQALAECDRTLDPGTLYTFKKMLVQTVQQEQNRAHKAEQDDFTYSEFLRQEQLARSFAADATVPAAAVRPTLN